jgi:hypothetical protein
MKKHYCVTEFSPQQISMGQGGLEMDGFAGDFLFGIISLLRYFVVRFWY